MIKKRRRQGKTDYKARLNLLKSGKPRIIFRKTNRYITAGYINSKEAQDSVVIGSTSKELLKYGWPENREGSLKSLPACYLTGFLFGKKVIDKDFDKNAVFDIGLIRNIPKSRAYCFLKGVVDAGIKVRVEEKMFPEEKRLRGLHLKNVISEIFDKIKENIEKKFV